MPRYEPHGHDDGSTRVGDEHDVADERAHPDEPHPRIVSTARFDELREDYCRRCGIALVPGEAHLH
ncbi:hypothetical protein FLP10_04560 [Agromyces intestinalis]|uniref:Uncharacterized protein n=1 Tax=Agromyces intestinalis TaxID=2592652 RepID=A0A5C1YCE7_9MICO|nr:hypothetical protein [Agromyces intestinalis]QEO13774.1 hypothetical protein FLP10_04560 [Agromyces intestinalis]